MLGLFKAIDIKRGLSVSNILQILRNARIEKYIRKELFMSSQCPSFRVAVVLHAPI